jgi:multiple sugar transport system permease protein
MKPFSEKAKYHWQLWSFLAPVLLGIIVFRVWPVLQAFYMSLFNYDLLSKAAKFVGLKNFMEIFSDYTFFNSVKVTFLYFLMRVPVQVALALVLALYISQKFRGVSVIRTIIFVPVVTSLVAVAVIWNLMYHPTYGIFNSMLNFVGLPQQDFLVDPHIALPAVVLSVLWKDVGFSMIIFLAGLLAIPRSYYDAAEVDGASAWQGFWKITLPLLKSTTMYVTVVTTIFTFQDFAPFYVMTQGGPMDTTKNLIYYIYENAFVYMRMGYANALSVIFFIILAGLSLLQMKTMTKAEI